MKVIGFNCSPHKKGNTFIAMQTVLEQLEAEGINTNIIQIGSEQISSCDGCGVCKKTKDGFCVIDKDNMNQYLKLAYQSQGILIGSPVYFGSVTPTAKALVDRMGYCARAGGFLLKRKVCAAVAAVRRQGAVDTINQVNNMFMLNQTIIPSSIYWNFAIGAKPGQVREDQEGMDTLKVLGENMAWLLQKVAND
ncbi:MAG: flavodoxin family protein [Actinomycetota bacterium]|nr:flavodoxin family protein [Actinomycetota bacterium]